MGFCDMHLRAISQEMLMNLIRNHELENYTFELIATYSRCQ